MDLAYCNTELQKKCLYDNNCLLFQELVRDHCHLATDYNRELQEWVSNDHYDDYVHKIQLPYSNVSTGVH